MREAHPRGELPLVLASASPRRAAILDELGIVHQVDPARIDERPAAGESPRAHVERLAREKAFGVARRRPGAWVLAGDTVVVLDAPGGEAILGKPRDADDAVAMLLRLAGREHRVLSALALVRPRGAGDPAGPGGWVRSGVAETRVRFRPFDQATARAYAATGEPLDKAGAYAIQGRGAALVDEITGDHSCVVGLPVPLLVRLLDEAGRPYRFGEGGGSEGVAPGGPSSHDVESIVPRRRPEP